MASRIPVARLLAEGVVVVGSILLAFAIDAGWDARQERTEELRILETLLDEALENRQEFERMTGYHRQAAATTSLIIDEGVRESRGVSPDSLDHLLIDVSGWLLPEYDRSALDATLLGGKLGLISDPQLTRLLARWQRDLEVAIRMEDDHQGVMRQAWMPFLRIHASVPQLSNAQTTLFDGSDRYATQTPVAFTRDHHELFRLPEFHNLLQEKKWLHEDALATYGDFELTLADLIASLQQALNTGGGAS